MRPPARPLSRFLPPIFGWLRPIFGAQFTEREGARLDRIEAGFGKSTEGNKRLLRQTLALANAEAERGIKAALASKDFQAAADIQSQMNLDLAPPEAVPTGDTAINPQTGERMQHMSDDTWVPIDG